MLFVHGWYAGGAWIGAGELIFRKRNVYGLRGACTRASISYAGRDRSGSVLLGVGCGVAGCRRNSCQILGGPEEFLLGICHTVEFLSPNYANRKITWRPGINSCQPAFRIRIRTKPARWEERTICFRPVLLANRSARQSFWQPIGWAPVRASYHTVRSWFIPRGDRILYVVFCRG